MTAGDARGAARVNGIGDLISWRFPLQPGQTRNNRSRRALSCRYIPPKNQNNFSYVKNIL